jgi:hypothetical protein
VPNVARSLEADLQDLTSIALGRFRCRKSDRPVAAHGGQLENGCPSSGVHAADQESKFGAISAVSKRSVIDVLTACGVFAVAGRLSCGFCFLL